MLIKQQWRFLLLQVAYGPTNQGSEVDISLLLTQRLIGAALLQFWFKKSEQFEMFCACK